MSGSEYSYLFGHELLKLIYYLTQTKPLKSGQAAQEPTSCFHQQQVNFHLPPDAWMDHL